MKKILFLILSILVARSAHADACATMLAPPFTGAQANSLCQKNGRSVAISQVPQTNVSVDLGTAALAWRASYVGQYRSIAANLETVAGTGSTQGTAAALSATKNFHQITGANGTLAWVFATPVAGDFHVLLNTTAGIAQIYPQTGATINGAGANAVFSALTGIKPIICFATSTTAWICS